MAWIARPVWALYALWLAVACVLLVVPAAADDGLLQEFGSMVVDNYHEMGCTLCDLDGVPLRNSLLTGLSSMGWTQTQPFPKDNEACTSSLIDVSGGSNLPDTVDLFYWSGQSFSFSGPTTGAVLHMPSGHESGCSAYRDTGNIGHGEVRLGDNDNEVALWVTCKFFENKNQESLRNAIKRMNHHSHVNCGYATSSYDTGKHDQTWAGTTLADLWYGANGCGPCRIAAGWLSMNHGYQPAGVVARATVWLGPDPDDLPMWGCQFDYLPGNRMGWGYGGQPPACASGEAYSGYDYFAFCSCTAN